MCHYAYSQFAACGHRVIKVVNFCEKALWRAAMFGQLGPCPEIAFRYQLAKAFNPHAVKQVPPAEEQNHVWRGMTGYCRGCEHQYMMHRLLHSQNHHDTHLSAFSCKDVVASIHSYNGPSIPSSPASTEHPYVYLPFVNRSLYELLGVADQYNDTFQSTCRILFFPSTIFLYTTFEKWRSPAHVNGVMLTEPPNKYFALNCGLTPLDRKFIGDQIANGTTLEQIWVMRYAQRGIYRDLFLKVAAKGEVYISKRMDERVEGNEILDLLLFRPLA